MTMSLLLEHFDELLAAPEDVEQFNRAILQLAIQGKLVQQDTNDEPAVISLRQSNIELSLMSPGIRRSKWINSEPIEDHETPFPLPTGWTWARINDTGFYINGLAFKPSDWKLDGIPIIRIQNLTDPNNPFNYATGPFEDDVMVKKGDILVSWSATLETFWWDKDDAVLNQHIFRVVPAKTLIDKRYLYYLLRQAIRDMAESVIAHGLVMSHINKGPFLSHVVAIPPINEQARIVERLEELFVQTRALAKELAHSQIELEGLNKSALSHLLASETPEEFNQHWEFIAEHFDLLFQTPEHVAPLRQSILELAVRGKLTRRDVGDESARELLKRISEEKAKNKKKETITPIKDDEKPFDLPVAWEWARLKQVTIDLQTGPFGSNLHKSDYVSNGIPIVNPVNMRDGKIVPLSQMMISEKTRERLSQYILEEGDLVLARRGEIGRCALVTEKESGWLCGTGSLRMKLSENISKGFIVLLLKTDFARSRLTKETVGITMSNMSQTGLENLTFTLPPLAEQERIVKRVEQLLSLCDVLEARLQSAEEERGRLVAAVMSTVGGSNGK